MNKLSFAGVLSLGIVSGFLAGWIVCGQSKAEAFDSLVAFAWGDGRYGPAFYGAHVYVRPSGSGYRVFGRVMIGRGNGYVHDLGQLGTVKTQQEAVQRFGEIKWRADGLYIGDGQTFPVVLERSKLEAHR